MPGEMERGRVYADAYVNDCVRYGARRFDDQWCAIRQVVRNGGWYSQLHTAIPTKDAETALGLAAQRAYVERMQREEAKHNGSTD